jgi:hypothetical protein
MVAILMLLPESTATHPSGSVHLKAVTLPQAEKRMLVIASTANKEIRFIFSPLEFKPHCTLDLIDL